MSLDFIHKMHIFPNDTVTLQTRTKRRYLKALKLSSQLKNNWLYKYTLKDSQRKHEVLLYASMSFLVYFLNIEVLNIYYVFNVMTTSADHCFCQ